MSKKNMDQQVLLEEIELYLILKETNIGSLQKLIIK